VPEAPISRAKAPDETIFLPYAVILKHTGNEVAVSNLGGHAMSNFENGNAGSESWDPALWSIGTVLGVAIVYLACLT
jgi:hypothetical protein